MKGTTRLLLFGTIFALAAACAPPGGQIIGTISGDVDQIPAKLGLYPLLSVPLAARERVHHRVLSAEETFAVRKSMDDNVVIVPPTETALSVTRESQIMTGLISTQLAAYGFSLKELPVEVVKDDDDTSKPKKNEKQFVISLNLLRQLREEYDVQALLVGNVFFINMAGRGLPPEQLVVSAHLKVIDVATLDVLGQVNLTYDPYGVDMNLVSEYLAEELAVMADLVEIKDE